MRTDRLSELLPAVFRNTAGEATTMAGLLEAQVALLDPAERTLERLEEHFDPWRAPAPFVDMLARWVGLGGLLIDPDPATGLEREPPLDRRRALVAAGARLTALRGTSAGLVLVLELGTGVRGFSTAEDERRPFHVTVHAPRAARVQRRWIARAVACEKPAHVTADVVFGDPASEASP